MLLKCGNKHLNPREHTPFIFTCLKPDYFLPDPYVLSTAKHCSTKRFYLYVIPQF